MSDYGKLMSRIWGDKEFTALDAREQQVFMMLFSFPTRNLAGVLPLTIRRWTTCTADATTENVRAALDVLVRERFIIIDWDTEEVLIRTYIRNDEIWKQPNLMVRCLKYCAAVASESLRCAIAFELARITQDLMPTGKPGQQKIHEDTLLVAKTLVKTFTEGFQEGLVIPSEMPYIEPIQETLLDTFAEPPGVGGYLGDTYTPAPAPAPDTVTTTDTNPPSGVSKGVVLVEGVSLDLGKTKRGTRLPEGWEPREDIIREMRTEFPHIDLRHEHAKFCDYWQSKAGREATKIDWGKTWRNWIRTAAERTPVQNSSMSAGDRRVLEGEELKRKFRAREIGELGSGYSGRD